AAARPAGLTAQATATGTFSDGSTRDVTAAVGWTTSGAAAAVDASGRIQAASVGLVEVVATLNGAVAAAPFEVTAAQVVALAFQDLNASLPLGLTADVRLVATYTDGSTADVAAQAALEVADPGVATVDAAGSIGILSASARKLRGVAAGATTLVASFEGLTVSAPVEILPATLLSLVVDPPAGRIKKGEVVAFTATGTFSDGSTAPMTAQVTWTSGDQTYALVYGFMDPGSIFARENGTVTIRATDPVTGLFAEYQLVIR
ncbi:MAG: Ig-like domain-containing protein, partial [Anaeromyxobacteraceae bacterium]|nr:Ig-like domain-containing protein [Anaeromyxobacteraceae bacterium]